jgi:hypothetical protein
MRRGMKADATHMSTSDREDDELLQSIRDKAHRQGPDTRRGWFGQTVTPAVAQPDDLNLAENSLGFLLHPFHRRILAEVADGGFGPSHGIYGVGTDGYRDEALGGGLVEVRSALGAGNTGFLAMPAAPLQDLGCGAWLYVDSNSTDGRLLLLTGRGVYRTEHDIRTWFRLWLDDRASRAIFFDASKASRKRGTNPFTRQPMDFVGEGPPLGELIHIWPDDV